MSCNIYQGVYKEKGSVFYCNIKSLNSKEALDELKKETICLHKKIKHVLVIASYIDNNGSNVTVASNDREPIKTANEILLVLERNGIKNIGVCIARHFGGTLLGAANLGKAYYKAFNEAFIKFMNAENL